MILALLLAAADYRIEAQLDPQTHLVSGEERLVWTNESDETLSTVYLHLYLNAFSKGSTSMQENEVFEMAGRGKVELEPDEMGDMVITGLRQGGRDLQSRFVQPDRGPATDRTVLEVALAEPVQPGASVTLDIVFESLLPKAAQRTGYHHDFHLVAQWFPKVAVYIDGAWNAHEYHFLSEFFADFGTYDVTLHVPEGWKTAAVGKRIGKDHYRQERVHDFAWMAAPNVELIERTEGDVHIETWFPEEYRASAELCGEAIASSLAEMSKLLMPYPYETVTCVVPPFGAGSELGGMEYPTFFTSFGASRVPVGSLERYVSESTAVHELVHGYFYGIVASNEFEEPMLDEGVTSYWENRLTHSAEGYAPALLLPFWPKVHLDRDTSARASLEKYLDPLANNSWQRISLASYVYVYAGTNAVLRFLEKRLPPGDFDKGMRAYVEKWAFKHPHIEDFENALASATKQPDIVHETFNAFVYGSHLVDDRVTDVNEHVVLVERHGAQVLQTLRVTFDSGEPELLTWPTGEPWRRFSFPDRTILKAELDPERRILLEKNKLDDIRVREADFSGATQLWRVVSPWIRFLLGVLVTA